MMILKNSKGKNSKKSLDKSTSSRVVSPASLTALQENRKEPMTIDISGQKCFELLPKCNQGGLLQRMCEELLTSKTAWSSNVCALIWRTKDTKYNRLIFQLRASVRPTKGKESGLWATPNTMDHLPPRSKEGTLKMMHGQRKGRTRPSNLREQVDPETMKLWRTPDAHCDRGPASEERMKMKLEKKMPISLNDQVRHQQILWPTPRASGQENPESLIKRKGVQKAMQHNLTAAVQMVPTPTSRDHKDNGPNTNYAKAKAKHRLAGHAGGSLNPTWVEWLMGYKAGYTDLKHWETLSSRKSQKKSQKQ